MHFRAKNWTEHPTLLQDLVRLAGDEEKQGTHQNRNRWQKQG